MRIPSRTDLENLARAGRERLASPRPRLAVGMSSCGLAAGSGEVFAALSAAAGDQALLVQTGCLGFCGAEPLVDLTLPGKGRVVYGPFSPELAEEFWAEAKEGRFYEDEALGCLEPAFGVGPAVVEGFRPLAEHPFYRGQVRSVSRNLGLIDPGSLEEYAAQGGFAALARVLYEMSPEEVIAAVKASGLRGRGGAGFPTGRKWEMTHRAGPAPRWLVMNGEEGDPGAYMDRGLMEGDPLAVIEGMLIGALAMGAQRGVLYLRAEYPLAIQRLGLAADKCREAGLLGKDILGRGLDFDLDLVAGAGAFVSGEETALIASIEGRPAEPSPRPPFPSQSGLYGRPTCINNVETWANVPLILREGGPARTKLFCLAGDVARPGLVEVPLGTPLSVIVNRIGGGARGGLAVKALQTDGPLGACIPASAFDLPADYDSLPAVGATLGSGGLVVLSERNCLVDVARYFLDFARDESCGRCTPCREGAGHMARILENIAAGRASEADLERLEALARGVATTSLCGLGQTAPTPVLTSLRHFRAEYEAHVKERRCPAGVCPDLLTYSIDPEACNGCTLCVKECPTGAITGRKKKAHELNPAKCIKCGACLDVCAFDAIKVV
ncbi:MAG: NADH-ubiquinone oxidoreductase-F iron-sulfur binding region domain-containing protein [Thermodesulfobacteriota bacterium]